MADPKRQTDQEKAEAEGEESAIRYWVNEINSAKAREKNFRKEAQELIEIYEGEQPDLTPYNILYSNTETLGPAIYNAAPRPDTRPKAVNPGPVAEAASGLVDAYLNHFIDCGDQGYESYDSANRSSLLQALVPGRGLQRFHYDADVEKASDGSPKRVKYERVWGESLDWDKFLCGYAKTWCAVPWVAYIHNFTHQQAIDQLGIDSASLLTFSTRSDEDEDTPATFKDEEREKTAIVYEIWDKTTKRVFHISESVKQYVKSPIDDPYQLESFFPTQEPLQFFRRISAFLPVPLYRLYKNQAGELNKITRRIERLISGMKVRGAYDANVPDLAKILEGDDNTLVPLQNSITVQGGKLDSLIWLVPIEKHVTVLNELLQQRQQIKQVIFEIMGIADIMRGTSQASETLGAQEIKNQWGSLRLKSAQIAMQDFVRNGLRIAAELGFSKLGPDTIRQITQTTLPAQKDIDAMEQQVHMAMASGQQVPPQMQAQMAIPTFEECLALLKDDILRDYQIDIETNSTLDAEATEDKQNVTEFLNGFSQFFTAIGPLVAEGTLPFDAAKGIMLAVTKKYHLGRELQSYLIKMQPPQPQGQGGAQMQQVQKAQQQLQQDQMKLAQDRMKFQIDQMKAKTDQMKGGMQQDLSAAQNRMDLEKMMMDLEKVLTDIQNTHQQNTMQLQQQTQQAQFNLQNAAHTVQQKARDAQVANQQASHDLQMQGAQLANQQGQAAMDDQVRNAKFDTKQQVAAQKAKAAQAKQGPKTPK